MRELFRVGDEFSFLAIGTLDDATLRIELGFGEQRLVRALSFAETTRLLLTLATWAIRSTVQRGRHT